MSRLTKDQKAQKLLAEEYERKQQYIKEYPVRLMKALERASKIDQCQITVQDQYFIVEWLDDGDVFELSYFPPEWTDQRWDIENLEYHLDAHDREMAELEYKEKVRKEALSKLTDEERQLLGL